MHQLVFPSTVIQRNDGSSLNKMSPFYYKTSNNNDIYFRRFKDQN